MERRLVGGGVVARQPERALPRPVVPASWRQLGVLILDGSPSMLDPVSGLDGFCHSKEAAVGVAVRGLLADFRTSRKAASFTFAGVTFAERVTGRWGPTPAARLDLDGDYDPTSNGGDGTSLAAGLAEAERVCGAFLGEKADGLPSSAVVLLLTDGQCGTVEETRRVAARLAGDPRVLLACAYFASGGTTDGLDLLRLICTSVRSRRPRTARRCTTPTRCGLSGTAA